ncbi:ATP-binding cassette domain-containing protein [Pseudonocardia alaniniphila]|uniref:ABC transporter ATP-binding protein n=1 Tax=Pseudonocardia alaniniphila TaxID=75291 RepID=A0ABS9TTV5_9PSEU|nr:ABC transporter ATP-binding protein [Pseudonocardia alaniniphila]MCH6171992.1 ABC transporter ATP-binding protein [Pseudonocardia alaniniphila]
MVALRPAWEQHELGRTDVRVAPHGGPHDFFVPGDDDVLQPRGALPIQRAASATASGSVEVTGEQVLGAAESELNRVRGSRAAMVFQEPQTAVNPVRTVGWQLAEALRARGPISRSDARARAVELLEMVGIPEPRSRVRYYPHQLSGGQKQRVVIALALSGAPDLLIADEPTTALGVTVQAQILTLLAELRDLTGVAVLLITHNLGVVAELADRVVVLRSGRVVEQRRMTDLFARPATDYTRNLLDSVPALPSIAPEPGPAASPHPAVPDPVLTLAGVSVTYPARRGRPAFRAVHDVTLQVGRHEVLGLVGESGSGKTTIGRVAVGLVPVSAGTVHLDGADLARAGRSRLRELRRGLAMVHQDPAASLDPRLPVGESVAEPLRVPRVVSGPALDARIVELLENVRLPASYSVRLPSELSGGQRQRIALARALALSPQLVIADEPTSALDVSVQADVLALFAGLQRELGFACVFVSHDLAVVHEVADRVAVLRAGELLELGRPREVRVAARSDAHREDHLHHERSARASG